MELKIGKDQGYVVIDDSTGKIMSILVKDGVKGKFDFLTTTSYKREGDKHFNMRTDTMIAPMDPQLEKDIMSGKTKFIVKNTPNDQELGAKIREWYWKQNKIKTYNKSSDE